MKAATGYKSGNEFRTTALGNRYTNHQMIAHILGHAKDAQGKPRDNKHKKVAKDMQNVKDTLEGEMRDEREAGRHIFETNDDEWAAAVMKSSGSHGANGTHRLHRKTEWKRPGMSGTVIGQT